MLEGYNVNDEIVKVLLEKESKCCKEAKILDKEFATLLTKLFNLRKEYGKVLNGLEQLNAPYSAFAEDIIKRMDEVLERNS